MGAIEEWIAEMFLTHSLNLLRFSAGVQDKIIGLLAAMSNDLAAKLGEGEISDYGKQRLTALLRESNAVIASHYSGMQAELARNLSGLTRIEADYTAKVLTQAFKIELGAKLPPAAYLDKLVGDTLIKGAPSADWWKRQTQATQFRFADQVRLGAAQGETTSQIVARVVGKSAKAAGEDAEAMPGILKTSEANARALVHSSVQAVANAARLASFQENPDLIECLVWLSTLDSNTCLLCAARDLMEYSLHDQEPINHALEWAGGPGAIHFSCRCVITTRAKTFAELGIELDEPAAGTRPSSGGAVSAKMNFKDFLASKDKAWRAEYLGPGRAEMYEAGKITLNDLMNLKGRKLTLEELREKYK